MDRYKASIESVDNALNRLNQTLASYRLLAADSTKSSSATSATRSGHDTQGDGHAPPLQNAKQKSVKPNGALEDALRRSVGPKGITPVLEGSLIETMVIGLRSTNKYPEQNVKSSVRFARFQAAWEMYERIQLDIPITLALAIELLGLGYPDLAAGYAYKALLLADAVDDEAEDHHEEVCANLMRCITTQTLEERIKVIRLAMDHELERATPSQVDPSRDVEITVWMRTHYRLITYRVFTRSLLLCGSLRSALTYSRQALGLYPKDAELISIHKAILEVGARRGYPLATDNRSSLSEWRDDGLVRREKYLWNEYEPDRLNSIEELNGMMKKIAPKLEVRRVDLPALAGEEGGVSTQLGVFAKEDIAPGEECLSEISILTANNRLQDALCETCSADLPALDANDSEAVTCDYCPVIFCSEICHYVAMERFHPPLCDQDIEAIAKDVPPSEAADSLYSLLLLRALAISETLDCHPLHVPEVRFIWGDFTPLPKDSSQIFPDMLDPDSCIVPRTLPWSFEHNIRLPYHMLEKMEIDIFLESNRYDVWVFNTLYAKFRGTASARLSGLGGRAIRGPEVSAVHPMWCLANHSCDPNVRWEWGGSVKFTAREQRVAWASRGRDGEKHAVVKSSAGIRKGEEILSHYCDVDLPVRERREWARGALGGDCRCERCLWEAAAAAGDEDEDEEDEAVTGKTSNEVSEV